MPSSIFSAARIVPLTMSLTWVQLRICSPVPQTTYGILLDERARDHRDDRVVLVPAIAVDREVAAAGGLHAGLVVVGAQRHLGHQLRPAVEVVGVVGRADHVLGEVEDLSWIGLQVVRIDAARRGVDDFLDAGLVAGLEQQRRRARGWSRRRPGGGRRSRGRRGRPRGGRRRRCRCDCLVGHARIVEVAVHELDAPASTCVLDVVELAAARGCRRRGPWRPARPAHRRDASR